MQEQDVLMMKRGYSITAKSDVGRGMYLEYAILSIAYLLVTALHFKPACHPINNRSPAGPTPLEIGAFGAPGPLCAPVS